VLTDFDTSSFTLSHEVLLDNKVKDAQTDEVKDKVFQVSDS